MAWTSEFVPDPRDVPGAQIPYRADACKHEKVIWAADGVDGVCKECGEKRLPLFLSLPPQSD